MRWVLSVCLAFYLLGSSLLQGELRTFTNDFGDSVEAELVEFKAGDSIICMRLKNGREIDAKLSAFSQADQKYIRNCCSNARRESSMTRISSTS